MERIKPEIKVGQTWEVNDPRAPRRTFKVIEIRPVEGVDGMFIVRADYGYRKTWIKADRFLPWQKKGYTLVSETMATPGLQTGT